MGRPGIFPLSPERWPDVERLFGSRGACAGCWCQYWRQRGSEWKRRSNDGNRSRFEAQVREGTAPGLVGYEDDRPVAWCQVGPRECYARILAAPSRQPMDARRTWVLTCFFVAKEARGRGWMRRLSEAAIEYAFSNGAECVEAWPLRGDKRTAATFAYVGHAPTLETLGFREVEHVTANGRSYRRHRLERPEP